MALFSKPIGFYIFRGILKERHSEKYPMSLDMFSGGCLALNRPYFQATPSVLNPSTFRLDQVEDLRLLPDSFHLLEPPTALTSPVHGENINMALGQSRRTVSIHVKTNNGHEATLV